MTAIAAGSAAFRPGWRRWLRPLAVAVLTVAAIAALAVYVFPTRTWLDQREALARTRAELDSLRAERAELDARVELLDSDAEIERIARSQYGLVRPGEEAYAVLPAPPPVLEWPVSWLVGGTATASGSGPPVDE